MAEPPVGSGGDASGSGGSGATPASLAATLRHMLTVDDDDFDCTLILALPGEPDAQEGTKEGEGRPAKRAKQDSKAPAETCRLPRIVGGAQAAQRGFQASGGARTDLI